MNGSNLTRERYRATRKVTVVGAVVNLLLSTAQL
ncbi:MAG TPA: cation-efflux pump, partial [Gammaproteobacteria bacterium]|nr:cation-efflux pump [Gammaproteobacteria bacterium]